MAKLHLALFDLMMGLRPSTVHVIKKLIHFAEQELNKCSHEDWERDSSDKLSGLLSGVFEETDIEGVYEASQDWIDRVRGSVPRSQSPPSIPFPEGGVETNNSRSVRSFERTQREAFVEVVGTGETLYGALAPLYNRILSKSFDPHNSRLFVLTPPDISSVKTAKAYLDKTEEQLKGLGRILHKWRAQRVRLTGLSRGGGAVLIFADEFQRSFEASLEVVALSSAIARPERMLFPMVLFAALEPMTEELAKRLEPFGDVGERVLSLLTFGAQIMGTGITHDVLGIRDELTLRAVVIDILRLGGALARFQTVEFSLLVKASTKDLKIAVASGLRRTLVNSSIKLLVLYGNEDNAIDVADCERVLLSAAPEAESCLRRIEGGHAITRAYGDDPNHPSTPRHANELIDAYFSEGIWEQSTDCQQPLQSAEPKLLSFGRTLFCLTWLLPYSMKICWLSFKVSTSDVHRQSYTLPPRCVPEVRTSGWSDGGDLLPDIPQPVLVPNPEDTEMGLLPDPYRKSEQTKETSQGKERPCVFDPKGE